MKQGKILRGGYKGYRDTSISTRTRSRIQHTEARRPSVRILAMHFGGISWKRRRRGRQSMRLDHLPVLLSFHHPGRLKTLTGITPGQPMKLLHHQQRGSSERLWRTIFPATAGLQGAELKGNHASRSRPGLRSEPTYIARASELDNTPIDPMDETSMMRPFDGASKMPYKPAFGISLERLHERDRCLVPILVQKCTDALRRFGTGMTRIYSDSALEMDSGFVIEELVARFDHCTSLHP